MSKIFKNLNYLFFSLCVLSIFSTPEYASAQCVTPPPGLVSWWTADNSTNDLIGGNNTILQNGASYGAGKVGPAFLLNSYSAYVRVPHNTNLMPTTGISVDAWINRSRTNASFDPIVKKSGEGSYQGHGYALEYSGNGILFWVYVSRPGWPDTWMASPYALVSNGQWIHVTGTYDGTSIRLYVNGSEVGTGTFAHGTIVPSSNDLNIGRDPSNSTTRFFSGLIDEVEIFNRALTAQEIQSIYLAGGDGKCKQVESVANAGADQSVDEATLVTLDGSSSTDPQGQPLTFLWEQVLDGEPVILSNETDQKPTFTAPHVKQNVTLTFRLTVTDPNGNSSTDDVSVTVVHVNHQPVAIAAPANQDCKSPINPATIREGAYGSLSGECSYDPDGDSITYAWTQPLNGPQVDWTSNSEQSSSTPSFKAPLANAGGNLTFQLIVSDDTLASSPSIISLELVANSTPIVNAGAPQTIGENTLVTLHGTASDPDSDPITIAWNQISDPMMVILDHPDTLTPSFLAPLVGAGGADLTFRLRADDNYL